MRLFVLLSLFLMLPALASAQDQRYASLSEGTEDAVRQHFEHMEAVLADRMDYESLIGFFHRTIDDNAMFEMRVQNPALPQAVNGQSFSMSKQDYINSYLIGSAGVRDYAVSVRPVSIQTQGNTVQTREIISERGYVVSTPDQAALPQYFESRTTCQSVRDVVGRNIKLLESRCDTVVSMESSI
jgi:hypothetical protein